jgi:hypothetical protein
MQTDDPLSRREAQELYDRLSERGRRRRQTRRLVHATGTAAAIVLIVGALVWSGLGLATLGREDPPADSPTPQPTVRPEATYTVQVISLEPSSAGEDYVRAKVRMRWASDTYPGLSECRLAVIGPDGAEVGKAREWWLTMPRTNQPVDVFMDMAKAPLDHFEASCGPRLDVGKPYAYRLGGVRIGHSETGLRVSAFAEWAGPEPAGIVSCRVALLGPDTDLLVSREGILVGFHDRMLPPDGSHPWPFERLEVELSERGIEDMPVASLTADIACVPHTGGDETYPPLPSSLQRPIQYPYDRPAGDLPTYRYHDVIFAPELDHWVVRYTVSWIDGVFPGEHECTTTIWDEGGNILETHTHNPLLIAIPLHKRSSGPLDSRPARFEASCGPRLDTPVAYEISDERLERTDDGWQVAYRVQWPAGIPEGSHPASNQCVVAIVAGGRIEALQQFSLGGVRPGDASTAHIDWDGRPADTAEGVVRCAPFDGHMDQFVERVRSELETGR